MPAVLDRGEIKDRLPHRFENLLLDKCKLESELGKGSFELLIPENDEFGRDIFLKKKTKDTAVLQPTILMEILALAAIATTCKIPEGKNAFFAAISNFQKQGDFSDNTLIPGTVHKDADKSGFMRYIGSLATNEASAKGNAMAFITEMVQTNVETGDKKSKEIPAANLDEPVAKPDYKSKDMFLADKLIHYNQDTNEVVCEYAYPKDHPLTKGHFPKNSIMMGVMQWMMMEDACFVLAKKLEAQGKTGQYQIKGDADIVKPDGTIVCEIKRAVVDTFINCPPILDQTDVVETKKVGFRDIVKAGETLFIHLMPTEITT